MRSFYWRWIKTAFTQSLGPIDLWTGLAGAALGAYQLSPDSPADLLRTYVPDLNDFVRRLSDEGVAEGEWSQVVHP